MTPSQEIRLEQLKTTSLWLVKFTTVFLVLYKVLTYFIATILWPGPTDIGQYAMRMNALLVNDIKVENQWFISAGAIYIAKLLALVNYEYRHIALHIIDDIMLISFLFLLHRRCLKLFNTNWPFLLGTTYLFSQLSTMPFDTLSNRDWYAFWSIFVGYFFSTSKSSYLNYTVAFSFLGIAIQFRPQAILFYPVISLIIFIHNYKSQSLIQLAGNIIAYFFLGLFISHLPLLYFKGFPQYYTDTFSFLYAGGHQGSKTGLSLIMKHLYQFCFNQSGSDLLFSFIIVVSINIITTSIADKNFDCNFLFNLLLQIIAIIWVSVNPAILDYHRIPFHLSICFFLMISSGYFCFKKNQLVPNSFLFCVLMICLVFNYKTSYSTGPSVRNNIRCLLAGKYTPMFYSGYQSDIEYPMKSWGVNRYDLDELHRFLSDEVDRSSIPLEIITLDPKSQTFFNFVLQNKPISQSFSCWDGILGSKTLSTEEIYLRDFNNFLSSLITATDGYILYIAEEQSIKSYFKGDKDITPEIERLKQVLNDHYQIVKAFGGIQILRKKKSVESKE